MRFMKLKEFSAETSLPVTVLRRMCKTRQIPSIMSGTCFFIEADGAKEKLSEMMNPKPRAFLERLESMRR